MIKYYKVKGQLSESITRRVPEILQQYCIRDFENDFYKLQRLGNDWYETAKKGCGWDFATKFPDFKWIKEPSLWHDIHSWLIEQGVIAVEANDVIDQVLADDCRKKSNPLMALIRAYYIRKGTNTYDSSMGHQRKVYRA